MFTSWRRRLLQRPGSTVDLAPMRAVLPAVAAQEPELSELTDGELTARATALREPAGMPDAEAVAAILAVGREAARRGLGERPYDVQLLGAQAMLAGHVVEMATGEGKTLAAAIAAAGFAAAGPVHVLTVNDYLARRDAEWMGPVYRLLGLSVGWVAESSTPAQRRAAYAADITYASISEAGFDFLRDGLCTDLAGRVQRDLATAIVDEADSILIDEARVPLVLAGSAAGEHDLPEAMAELVRTLRPGDHYAVAEDGRAAHLTSDGLAVIERALGDVDLYDGEQGELLTAVNVALHAEALLHRDVDYIVRDDRVELVDEFRGRVAQRRRWPDGLQAAVEAKEGLTGSGTGRVLSTITVQAFINLYPVKSGMTGTAVPVGEQLREFYGLEVAVVPPNRPCVRVDWPARVYATQAQKETALCAEIATAHATGRPVLIGTLSVSESERLADRLSAGGVECAVLNAKNDTAEAAIIAEAGAYGAVTVSTQMTGRGVDIRLGGSEEADRERVAALGGLYVIGTGSHDSSRVDDQLRGRAGRQGDPGESAFFVSLEDDLVTRYGPDRMPAVRPDADGYVGNPAAARAVAQAQRIAEQVNLEIHRNTWRYNVLIEKQRTAVAAQRADMLTTDAALRTLERLRPDRYKEMRADHDEEVLVRAARTIMLYHLDTCWAEHLATMADIREGIHLRALGQMDPLDEFHREAVPAFRSLLAEIEDRSVRTFDDLDLSGEGWNPADAGLVRPSATWTYVVHDNPFGPELTRFFTGLAQFLRRGRLRG
jgi:preprotein translocase subunit SecA